MPVVSLLGLAIPILACATGPMASAATLSGAVVDSTTGEPLEGVQVRAVAIAGSEAAGPGTGSITNATGRFSLSSLQPGSYVLLAWGVGVERRRIGPFTLTEGESLDVVLRSIPTAIRMNPIVVTGIATLGEGTERLPLPSRFSARHPSQSSRSRHPPRIFVRVVGVDVAAKGINQTSVVARGFSSAQSTALLALTDYRYTSIPSLRYNLFHYQPTAEEDMERIEVLRGPAAALYGPNSDRGVMHILTRDPWNGPGTSGSYAGGSRSVSQLSLRHAGRFGASWGYKFSGQYFRGDDWESVDPERRRRTVPRRSPMASRPTRFASEGGTTRTSTEEGKHSSRGDPQARPP